jgi:phosphodiesterase/alkaline phosphatase D-like protein
MLDTRTLRSPRRAATVANADLFDAATFADLTAWLTAAGPGPKFIVSPAMLLPRHRRALQHATDGGLTGPRRSALHADGWDGYPKTLAAVLGHIAEQGIHNVVFLSGDEHCGCVADIELRDQNDKPLTRLHSLHTTAAYAPFPFANGCIEDLVMAEVIPFVHNGVTYRCAVDAQPAPVRSGATLLSTRQDAGGTWHLDFEFSDKVVQTRAL